MNEELLENPEDKEKYAIFQSFSASKIHTKDSVVKFLFLFTSFNKMTQEAIVTGLPIILININGLNSQDVGFIFLAFFPFSKIIV